MRWFTDFEHIVFYAEIKLFVLAGLLLVMWMLVEQPIQLAPLYP
jgi:hypothetical protein